MTQDFNPLPGLFQAPGRKTNAPQQPLVVVPLRSLTESDLEAIAGIQRGDQGGASLAPLKRIHHLHHQAARLVALGKPDAEISLLTGYTPQRVRDLKKDPTFAELTAYYVAQLDSAWKGVAERASAVGLQALDELQARLDENPNGWTKRELMDFVKMMVIDPMARTPKAAQSEGGGVGVGGGAPRVEINVSFLTSADAQQPVPPRPEMIDVTPHFDGDD